MKPGIKAMPPGCYLRVASSARSTIPDGFFQTYPWMAGFICWDKWSVFEATENTYDFSYFDAQVTRARVDNKPVILQLKTGGAATSSNDAIPSWISGAPYYRPVHYRSDQSGDTNACPWDVVSRQKVLNALAAMGRRYDSERLVVGIYLCGVNGQYNEMVFPPGTTAFDAPSALTIANNPLAANGTSVTSNEDASAWQLKGGFRIDSEDFAYSNRVGNVFTISARGMNGTVADSHLQNAAITKYNPWTTITGNPPNEIWVDPDGVVLRDAYLDQARQVAARWPTTPIIVLVDRVRPTGTYTEVSIGWDTTLLVDRGVIAAIDSDVKLRQQVYYGTANIGDDVVMTDPRFARCRRTPIHPITGVPYGVRLAGIYHEVGDGHVTDAPGLYESLRRVRVDCGSTACMINWTTWGRGDDYKAAVRQASLDFWGI